MKSYASAKKLHTCFVKLRTRPSFSLITMVQSYHTTLLDDADFKEIYKNAYPIVICYNGSDHFTPTRPSTEPKYSGWKLNRELGPIISASLLVIEELDRHKLDPAVLTAVNQLEATIVQMLPIISPISNTSHLRAVAVQNKRGPLHRESLLQPGRQDVSTLHTQSVMDPASTTTQPSISQADDPEADEPTVKKRTPKKYVCNIWCGEAYEV